MNKKQLQKIVTQCVEASMLKGKVQDTAVKRCIKLFKSLSVSDAIWALEHYQQGLVRAQEQSTLIIESATPLSSLQQKAIEKKFARQCFITHSQTRIDSSLLGGIRVRIGDTVLDDSITARIDQLERSFA